MLVVDDDPTIAESVAVRLRAEGYAVVVAADGPGAVAAAAEHRPDLLVLDVMLPGYDGLEVCRRVQADRPVPVLMLTARDDETDELVGLGVGADDYLTKPFSMRVLVARVAALLRRVERQPTTGRLTVGDLVVDAAERRAWVEGEEVHLTRTEFDLLSALVARPRVALSREVLLEQVWGWQDASATRTVDSHVKALRRKVGDGRIRTVQGVGYALEAPR